MNIGTKRKIADWASYVAILFVVSVAVSLLMLDTAISECGEIGFLTPILLYAALILSGFIGVVARFFGGKRKSIRAMYVLLIILAITPFFFEVYGYGGPACKAEPIPADRSVAD